MKILRNAYCRVVLLNGRKAWNKSILADIDSETHLWYLNLQVIPIFSIQIFLIEKLLSECGVEGTFLVSYFTLILGAWRFKDMNVDLRYF